MEIDAQAKPDIAVEARGIVKCYPGTVALKGVDFAIYQGQINVLVGENGAGKSTLMNLLAGVDTPSAGQILVYGKAVQFQSVRDAAGFGIAMVHQELSLLPNLNVAENIFAGRERHSRFGLLRWRQQEQESAAALELLQHPLPPRALAGALPLGDQQIVELARALVQQARILILDEPTSALSPPEVKALFRVLGQLKQNGASILYVSHRLDEVLEIGNFFTVLRDGQIVGQASRRTVSKRWLVENMTGRSSFQPSGDLGSTPAAETAGALSIRALTLAERLPQERERIRLSEISFTLRKGEILGVYGLLGAGRTELLECLAGLRPEFTGEVRLDGRLLRLESVASAIRSGLILVPEDRKRDGLVPELSLRENISLAGLSECCTGPWISRRKELEHIRRIETELNLKAGDRELPVSALSGGNQQKAILARCLMAKPAVLLLDEPTRGVDVGAKAEIYRILRRLAHQGLSIIFSTSEAEELTALADRCLVLSRGRITADANANPLPEELLYNAASSAPGGTDQAPSGSK